MRTLVVSDIHASAVALGAVLDAASYDRVWLLGDLVDLGPAPERVARRLSDRTTVPLAGNHDRAVLGEDPAVDAHDDWHRCRQWTLRRLSTKTVRALERRPQTTVVDTARADRPAIAGPDGRPAEVRLHHGDFAAPTDPAFDHWENRLHPDRDRAVFAALADRYPEPVVVHGHSHVPFDETVAGTRFVNPGSVAFGRDWWTTPPGRARYAVVADGDLSLRATSYDVEAACAAARDRLPPGVAERVTRIYREGG